MKRVIALLLCAVFLAFSLAVVTWADFGDFSGSYDYGGSSSSYSSSSSSGSSFSFGSSSYDSWGSSSSHSYGSSYGGSYGSSSGGGYTAYQYSDSDADAALIFWAILIVASLIAVPLIAYLTKTQSSRTFTRTTSSPGRQAVDNYLAHSQQNLRHISTFKELDPSFSETELTQKLSNIYVKLQDAWGQKDLTPVRPYLTDFLYNQYDRQLEHYRASQTTNITEHIAVLSIAISGWKPEGENDVIVANVKTRIVDYVVDDKTGSLVRGSRTAEKFMEYEYTLSRKHGIVTGSAEQNTKNCPNCGAVVNLNQSAVCEYCGTVITADPTDWVISGIRGISQRTVG